MTHDGDDGVLLIGPADSFDAGGAANEAVAPICADDEIGGDSAPVRESQAGKWAIGFQPGDRGGGDLRDGRDLGNALIERFADQPVLDNRAQRIIADLARIEMQEHRRGVVGHADIIDRAGMGRQFGPQTRRLQQLARAIGDGGGAAVMGAALQRRRRQALDQCDLQAGIAQDRGEGGAGNAAADDGDVEPFGHRPFSLSIARQPISRRQKPPGQSILSTAR